MLWILFLFRCSIYQYVKGIICYCIFVSNIERKKTMFSTMNMNKTKRKKNEKRKCMQIRACIFTRFVPEARLKILIFEQEKNVQMNNNIAIINIYISIHSFFFFYCHIFICTVV